MTAELKELSQPDVQRAFQRVFSGEDGGLVLELIYEAFGLHRRSFVQGDPYATAFQDGQRDAATWLWRILNTPIEKEQDDDGSEQ